MATEIEAARALVMETVRKRDTATNERDVIMYASMAKLFATEAAQRVVDQALQIHGGWGMVRETRVQLLYRAVRAPRVYEGTSEIQKITIARTLQQ